MNWIPIWNWRWQRGQEREKERIERQEEIESIQLPNGIHTVFSFLCSRKLKITNHRPQAISFKEPETPFPFLKQVCEDFKTVGHAYSFQKVFSGISLYWFWEETWKKSSCRYKNETHFLPENLGKIISLSFRSELVILSRKMVLDRF